MIQPIANVDLGIYFKTVIDLTPNTRCRYLRKTILKHPAECRQKALIQIPLIPKIGANQIVQNSAIKAVKTSRCTKPNGKNGHQT